MSVSLVYIGIIVGTLAVVLGITLLAMRLVRWRRDVALRRHGAPMLVMPIGNDTPIVQRPVLPREAAPRAAPESSVTPAGLPTPVHVRRVTPPEPPFVRDEARTLESPVGNTSPGGTFGDALPPDDATGDAAAPDGDGETVSTGPFRPGEVRPGSPSAHLVLGSQVRFFRAEEGTLEFLPGHLEVVGGEDVGQEIHFVRQLGEEGTVMTFGRSEGQPLRHIQLLDPTVSRQHARMAWDDQRWHLVNLSTTNAVVLNGAALGNDTEGVALEDGDRIEMGAVVFVFHSR